MKPTKMEKVTADKIFALLAEVKDPEIPVLSLVDLGVITRIDVQENQVVIQMTPTFVGCPALDTMQTEIRQVLAGNGIENVKIEVSYRKPWTSDMISEKGRQALKNFGLAPPPARELFADLDILEHAECPHCGSTNTELRNIFGATLCRAIHFCRNCRQAFEQFKPL